MQRWQVESQPIPLHRFSVALFDLSVWETVRMGYVWAVGACYVFHRGRGNIRIKSGCRSCSGFLMRLVVQFCKYLFAPMSGLPWELTGEPDTWPDVRIPDTLCSYNFLGNASGAGFPIIICEWCPSRFGVAGTAACCMRRLSTLLECWPRFSWAE
jgi:hypothetical protein